MSLFLQNPAFLGLLALAGVPLLVHLLSRARPPEYRFPDIAFLRKITATSARFKKPRDFILLALRTLAVLALAAAFLLPLLLSENSALPGEKRTTILLIDRSASMAAREGAASRFDAATARAAEYLSSARPDFANIIWIDSSPSAVFPEPAPNTAFLSDELARATPRPEPGAVDAAFALALRQLRDAPGRREIVLISDFQKTAWEKFSLKVPPGVSVQMLAAAESSLPNIAVTSLVAVPSSPVAGQTVLVQCRVANFSGEARRIPLTLDAGGSRQSLDLALPARGEAEAAFTVRVPSSGLLPITAEIAADPFRGDDRRHAVIRVRESLRLAVAAPETHPATQTLARVAAALPWLDLIPGASTEKLPPCEILCLPDWNGLNPSPEQLGEISQTTALLVFPSSACSDYAISRLLGSDGGQNSAILQTDPAGWEAAPVSDHPAFRLFSGGEFGNPLSGKFKERIGLPADISGKVIARFSDNLPALVEAEDKPILISALSLDPAKSTWPLEAPFLPAIAEILLHLAPQPAAEAFAILPGSFPAWTNPSADTSTAPSLDGPDAAPPAVSATGSTWTSSQPAVPGIYRWLVSAQPVHLAAANFPESESDLAPMDSPPSFSGKKTAAAGALNPGFSEGLPLWPYLLAAALILMLLEPLAERRIRPAQT